MTTVRNPLWDDWKVFIGEIKAKNVRSNERLFALLRHIKNEAFVRDLQILMGEFETGFGQLRIVREPKGLKVQDKRTESIREFWVDMKYTSMVKAEIYIQVKNNRFIKLWT